MTNNNEAFSRVFIDAQLKDRGWNIQDQNSVHYEYVLPDGSRADDVLCDRYGQSMAVIETRLFSIGLGEAAKHSKHYARQLNAPIELLQIRRGFNQWGKIFRINCKTSQ